MTWSSEALKNNIIPNKPMSEMSEKDWFEFRNTLDPDIMGFDGSEGYPVEEFEDEDIIGSSDTTSFDFIKNNLTTRNYTNGTSSRKIKYMVVHYTANNGDTAKGNTNYFKSTFRGASAHYFVDENSIYRCVEDKNISWHCGGGLQGSNGHTFYKKCLNSNSIGIEMCSRKDSSGNYYFKDDTVKNCLKLIKYLMNLYNIPIENIIRHYDVTGKICPAPYVKNQSKWTDFKKQLFEINYKPGIYKVINCTSLNVRLGNSTQYDIIDKLKPNDEIEIIEFNNNWGKIYLNNQYGWISLDYVEFISEKTSHWAQVYLDLLYNKQIITDISQWSDFESPISRELTIALIDKMTGGLYYVNNDYENNHWAIPHVLSLNAKNIITDVEQWIINLDDNISKALILALICNITGGVSDLYKNRITSHWAQNSLDTLCDRGIIETPSAWMDYESNVTKGLIMALLYKAIIKE